MSSITNSSADSSRYYTSSGTAISTSEIEARIARGQVPNVVPRNLSGPRIAAALAEARVARRKKPTVVPSPNLWRMIKRFVDNHVVSTPRVYANSNFQFGNYNGLQLYGTGNSDAAIYVSSAAGGGVSWNGGVANSFGGLTNTATRFRCGSILATTGFLFENPNEQGLLAIESSTGNVTARGDVACVGVNATGNLTVVGVTASGAVASSSTVTGAGVVSTSGVVLAASNALFVGKSLGAPATTAGSKLRLWANSAITPANSDYSIGVDASTLWLNAGASGKTSFMTNGVEMGSVSSTGTMALAGDLNVTGTVTAASYVGVGAATNCVWTTVLNGNLSWSSPIFNATTPSVGSSAYLLLNQSFVARTPYVCVTYSGSSFVIGSSSGRVKLLPYIRTGTTYITPDGDASKFVAYATDATSMPFTWVVHFDVTQGSTYFPWLSYNVIATGGTWVLHVNTVTVQHINAMRV